MTKDELLTHLETSGYPVTEICFERPVKLPFVVLMPGRDNNFFADGKVYQRGQEYDIELYTSRRGGNEAQGNIEDILDNASIPWTKDTVWISSEKMLETIYTITI